MKKHAAPIFAALLLLLPVLYVGSYLALLKTPSMSFIETRLGIRESRVTHYRIGKGEWDWVFFPLEQIDRKVRPARWGKLPRGGIYREPRS